MSGAELPPIEWSCVPCYDNGTWTVTGKLGNASVNHRIGDVAMHAFVLGKEEYLMGAIRRMEYVLRGGTVTP